MAAPATGTWTVRLRSSRPETEDTTTFVFDRGEPSYEWAPGQNLVMTIAGVEDPKGDTRPFTVSSSPTEAGTLAITTMLRGSPFKNALAALRPGDPVTLLPPEGEFTLKPGRPAIFVAGGIGVTPFRSMLRFATDTKLEKPLVLVYSARTPETLVFRSELEELARRNHAIRLLFTVTRHDASKGTWNGHTGRIDAALLREAMRGIRHPLWYFAGPPGLVHDNRKQCEDELGIAGADVLTDEFEGY